MERQLFSPIMWKDESLFLIDQRILPTEEHWVECRRVEEVAEAIRSMIVRGAPAIGITAGYGVALAFRRDVVQHVKNVDTYFEHVYTTLIETRPTAVNLRWALDRMKTLFHQIKHGSVQDMYEALVREAQSIHEEDIALNRKIGEHGAHLVRKPVRVLTICNAGALATGGYGTALGIIRSLHEQGKLVMVYAMETRPFLQGARLTVWELTREAIPVTLICDNMVGLLMKQNKVDIVVTGADRIARNGDTANKIGTYMVAVLANYHSIPMYIAAPYSTVDLNTFTGNDIPIEERHSAEIIYIQKVPITVPDVQVWNPAFDVTPAELITGIVTEKGVFERPYEESLVQAYIANA